MSAHNPLHHTDANALAMLLPAGELEVLRLFWIYGPLTVKAVHRHIAAQRDIAYTTTMTVCVRLAEKGLLRREKPARSLAYLYTPTMDEREFVTRSVTEMLDCVVKDFPSVLTQYLATRREYAAA